MQRQAIIYALYSLVALALVVYLVGVCIEAWERFGSSGTFWVAVCFAGIFSALTALFLWLAFLFRFRAVADIRERSGHFELIPSTDSIATPIGADNLHIVRKLGEQFSPNEINAEFVVFRAASRLWVTYAATVALRHQARSEA
jgi:hypothetical protein